LLAAGRPIEPLLRAFEWRLLEQLGYGFALDVDIDGRPIEPQALYQLLPEAGLEPVAQLQPGLFQGSELLSMADARAPGALQSASAMDNSSEPWN
ncbi:DNA repair protein RecO, partial [Pseudomonas aeruginosa]